MSNKFKNKTIIDYGYFSGLKHSKLQKNKIVPFDSQLGKKYFISSSFKNSFFKLAPHYSPQQHISTCGIASAIMVLNTIYASNNQKRPISDKSAMIISETNQIFANFIWTEDNFFNKLINKILKKNIVLGKSKHNGKLAPGISLSQLTQAINLHNIKAKFYPVADISEKSIKMFRNTIKKVTKSTDKFLIANYNIKIQLDKLDGGHFSPLGAYDETSDKVLVLDTWSSYTPWVWIDLVEIFKSMNTLDSDNYRGYIIVSRN